MSTNHMLDSGLEKKLELRSISTTSPGRSSVISIALLEVDVPFVT